MEKSFGGRVHFLICPRWMFGDNFLNCLPDGHNAPRTPNHFDRKTIGEVQNKIGSTDIGEVWFEPFRMKAICLIMRYC